MMRPDAAASDTAADERDDGADRTAETANDELGGDPSPIGVGGQTPARSGATAAAPGGGRTVRGLPGTKPGDSPLALDRLIHERLRLGIVSALAVNDSLTFVELKRLLQTTDGNLSVHARKLEEAGYLSLTKQFEGRVPRTEYRLTRAGRHAFDRYLDHMLAIIRATRSEGER